MRRPPEAKDERDFRFARLVGSFRERAVFRRFLSLTANGGMPSQRPFDLFGAVAQQAFLVILRKTGTFIRIPDMCEEVCHRLI